jgi:hypothetical protein
MVAGAVVTSLLGLGACGGGSSPSSTAAGTTSTTTSAATSTSTAPPGTTDDSGGESGGGSVAEFCTLVKAQTESLADTDLTTLIGSGKPSEWKAYFEQKAAENETLVLAAPAQIRPALDTLYATTKALRDALVKAGYDFSKVSVTEFTTTMRDPKFAAAGASLRSYVKSTCGVDLPNS